MSNIAAAFDWIRIGGQGNGHTAAPTFPGARRDHQYPALYGHVAGAVQKHLALISTPGLPTHALYSYDEDLAVFRRRWSSGNGALNESLISPFRPKQRCRFTGLGHFSPGTFDGRQGNAGTSLRRRRRRFAPLRNPHQAFDRRSKWIAVVPALDRRQQRRCRKAD